MGAIQILSELSFRRNKEKYASIPAHAIPRNKYNNKTANGLTRCIKDFIELSGGQAERISNTGRQIDKRKTYKDVLGNNKTIGSSTWIKGTGKNGTADISATIHGRSVKVEVKIGKDRMSEHQQTYKAVIEKAGGLYFVAKDFESFYKWYNETFERK